jgi:hypothetical protein
MGVGVLRAGHAAFAPDQPPPLAPELAKPLRRDGRFEPGYFVVRFAGPIEAEDERLLDVLTGPVRRADGSPLARAYVPDDALLAPLTSLASWRALARHPRVAWLGRLQPGYKLDAALAESAHTSPHATLRLNAELIPGHPVEVAARALEALGAGVLERVEHRGRGLRDLSFLVLEAPAALLPRLAGVEGVRAFERRGASEPFVEGHLPHELDGAWVAALARRAPGGLALEPSGPGPRSELVASFLDLLALDHPDAVIRVGLAHELEFAAPKNALFETRLVAARATSLAGSRGPSAVLQRALAARGDAAGRAELVRDVRAADAAWSDASFSVLASGEPIDLVLAWSDAPSPLGAPQSLTTDLDLVVSTPDGRAWPGVSEGGVPTEERVSLAPGIVGRVAVRVVLARGHATLRPAFAVAGAGLVEAPQRALAPTTLVLAPTSGLHSKDGNLAAGDLARLAASDDDRYVLRDREQLTLGFPSSVPADATVLAVRVWIEHHAIGRVGAGDVVWRLGRGSASAPTILASITAPLRSGAALEGADLWTPGVTSASSLQLVVQNNDADDDVLLDRAWLEVDTALPDAAPRFVSTPNARAVFGQAYHYDADDRAQATGTAPLVWSLAAGPAGFAIDAASGLVSWTPSALGAMTVSLRVANELGSELQTFVVDVASQPPLPATLLPVNLAPISYLPPERLASGAGKAQQRLNVFLPPGAPPAGGWPVVLNNRTGGGIAVLPLATLQTSGASAPLHAYVSSGVAVVDFGVTGIGDGNGLFYPPGHASGRYESFRPLDDAPEKDAEWAVQWLKTQSAYPLDPTRVCLRGSSHGAIIALWAAIGPERARASGTAQVRASTRVRGVLALQPPASIWAFDQTPAINSRIVAHYEQQAFPGLAANAFGQVAEALQKASSVMGFAFQSAEARLHNESQALCLVYAEPVKLVGGAPADMSLDAQGFPRLHATLGQPYVHDSWSGYVLWRRLLELSPSSAAFHRASSVFAIRDTTALPAPNDLHTRVYSGVLIGAQANALTHEWVLRTLGVTR